MNRLKWQKKCGKILHTSHFVPYHTICLYLTSNLRCRATFNKSHHGQRSVRLSSSKYDTIAHNYFNVVHLQHHLVPFLTVEKPICRHIPLPQKVYIERIDQKQRAPALFPEDLGINPNTHLATHNSLWHHCLRLCCLLLVSLVSNNASYSQKYMQAMNLHKNKVKQHKSIKFTWIKHLFTLEYNTNHCAHCSSLQTNNQVHQDKLEKIKCMLREDFIAKTTQFRKVMRNQSTKMENTPIYTTRQNTHPLPKHKVCSVKVFPW